MIIDSNMEKEKALAQNPERPAPQEILDLMEVLFVQYFGFDGLLHSGQIVINKNVSNDIRQFFDLAVKIKFPIEKVIPISDDKYKWSDEVSCNDNNSSGYNYRLIGGTDKLSKHAQGLGFDINPVQNIFVKYDKSLNEIIRYPKDGVYDKNIRGTLVSGDPLVKLMKNLGWDWGGDWTPETGREDYQHFEKNI